VSAEGTVHIGFARKVQGKLEDERRATTDEPDNDAHASAGLVRRHFPHRPPLQRHSSIQSTRLHHRQAMTAVVTRSLLPAARMLHKRHTRLLANRESHRCG
jgi:hypothetical protein